MLSYSYRTAKAQARLKIQYNDVDIFVEDSSNRNMWLIAVRALLPQGTRLSSVIPLGGRDAVTKACRLDQTATGRKKLYIIDGDFDFLLGKQRQRLKYLYRLRANNIENLLVFEEALVAVALEYQPTKSEQELRALIDYNPYIALLENAFRPLFVAYAVSQVLCPSIQTTGFSVTALIVNQPSGPVVDYTKLRRRIIILYLRISREVGVQMVRDTWRDIHSRAITLRTTQVVSGKDYLLPLFLLKFKAVCGYGGATESFKVALARSFSPSAEPFLARRLRNLRH